MRENFRYFHIVVHIVSLTLFLQNIVKAMFLTAIRGSTNHQFQLPFANFQELFEFQELYEVKEFFELQEFL